MRNPKCRLFSPLRVTAMRPCNGALRPTSILGVVVRVPGYAAVRVYIVSHPLPHKNVTITTTHIDAMTTTATHTEAQYDDNQRHQCLPGDQNDDDVIANDRRPEVSGIQRTCKQRQRNLSSLNRRIVECSRPSQICLLYVKQDYCFQLVTFTPRRDTYVGFCLYKEDY